MSVVILGNGLLGQELHKQTGWDILSRKESGIDLRVPESYTSLIENYSTVVNCIAHTDTYSEEKDLHWQVNVMALDALIDECNRLNKKLVHISTDYIYANSITLASEDTVPVSIGTWYGYTKLVGDALVQARCKEFLLCRLSHKPNPFPYDSAWNNLYTNCDSVDVIGNILVDLIDSKALGVYNVGTEPKTIYDLAIKTNNKTTPGARPSFAPADVSMNVNKLQTFFKER